MKKIIVSVIVLMFAYCHQSFSQNSTSSLKNGKVVYMTYCTSCHMEDGNGLQGAFPSLVKTGNLNDKNKLVKIVLQGMRGPIMVKGVKYDTEMAAINMSDQEVADVINYIRNSWGNKAPQIKVTNVTSAKKAVVKGYQPY